MIRATLIFAAVLFAASPASAGCDIYGQNCGERNVYGQSLKHNPPQTRSFGERDRSGFQYPRRVQPQERTGRPNPYAQERRDSFSYPRRSRTGR